MEELHTSGREVTRECMPEKKKRSPADTSIPISSDAYDSSDDFMPSAIKAVGHIKRSDTTDEDESGEATRVKVTSKNVGIAKKPTDAPGTADHTPDSSDSSDPDSRDDGVPPSKGKVTIKVKVTGIARKRRQLGPAARQRFSCPVKGCVGQVRDLKRHFANCHGEIPQLKCDELIALKGNVYRCPVNGCAFRGKRIDIHLCSKKHSIKKGGVEYTDYMESKEKFKTPLLHKERTREEPARLTQQSDSEIYVEYIEDESDESEEGHVDPALEDTLDLAEVNPADEVPAVPKKAPHSNQRKEKKRKRSGCLRGDIKTERGVLALHPKLY